MRKREQSSFSENENLFFNVTSINVTSKFHIFSCIKITRKILIRSARHSQ